MSRTAKKQIEFTVVASSKKRGRRRRSNWTARIRAAISNVLSRLRQCHAGPTRKLRLCESVSLGEKRFAAVLEFEEQRFLIGGAGQSVQLLSELRPSGFAEALGQQGEPFKVKQ